MSGVVAANLAVVVAALIGLWLVSLRRRDASIIDPFWGVGFVVVAWLTRWQLGDVGWRSTAIVALTTAWGLRLALFLLWRNWGHGEDRRYAAMRQQHGERFGLVSLGTVFLLQAVLLWFVSLPIQLGQSSSERPPGWLDVAAAFLWTVGLVFEAVGDWQMARFRADPRNGGRVCDQGLWRYTRHPNYFGDFCVWWGLYLLSVGGGAGWTIGSPLLMSFLLLKVSGVALLEKDIADRRPAYRDYAARTSSFFPWRPRTPRKSH